MDILEIFNLLFFQPVFILFILFFIVVVIKKILFWLYLWQLKEYHTGRFIDHFSAAKGKKLLLNEVNLLKIFFLFIIIYSYITSGDDPTDPWLGLFILSLLSLFFIYAAEGLKVLKDLFQKKLKKPIFTKKIIFLFPITVIAATIFLYFTLQKEVLLTILFFDLLIPFIVSAIVLLFQPLAILERNRIIRRAKEKRVEFKDLLVVGVTGSYGKTSTKEFLSAILAEKFGEKKILKTKKHQNSEVGISQCIISDLKPEHEIFVCEMGAYNRRGIKLLCDIVKPKIGILTGINEQHMATFGSQENIIKAKLELFESLPEDGVAILNWDAKKFSIFNFQFSNKSQSPNSRVKNIKLYSVGEKTDIWAESVKIEKEIIYFRTIAKDGDSAEFKVNLLGGHNILNILGAAAAAKELGMSLKEISSACEKIKPEQSGFQLKEGVGGLNIIDATYSANPDSVISHLEYLKIFDVLTNSTGVEKVSSQKIKKIIIMPCLIELGSASEEVHKRLGGKIGEVCDLAIITTRERFAEIKEAAFAKAAASQKAAEIIFIEDPKKIFEKIKSFCGTGDVILLESRLPAELIKRLITAN